MPALPSRPEDAPAAVPDEVRVRRTLDSYARASGRLDVDATASVWPSVDRLALTRAFANLKSQDVTLGNCSIELETGTATARCRGSVRFVRRVGSPTARVVPQQWTFRLKDDGDAWTIDGLVAGPLERARR